MDIKIGEVPTDVLTSQNLAELKKAFGRVNGVQIVGDRETLRVKSVVIEFSSGQADQVAEICKKFGTRLDASGH